jgi:hypothetical protein
MTAGTRQLLWQVPLAVGASVFGSLVVVWAISQAMGFHFNPSLVAALSGALSAAAIAVELHRQRQR